MEYPNTRKEAKALGAKYYFTGQPCKHGHIALRKTKGACVECIKTEWQESGPKRAEYFINYNRSESSKARKQEWYAANKELTIARANTQPMHLRRKYKAAYKERNPEATKAIVNERRRRHRDASPKWLTKEQKVEMRKLYRMAVDLTAATGEQYAVDHIWPIMHPDVCGLHVPWNLRVTTQTENLVKSNKLPDISEGLAFPPK